MSEAMTGMTLAHPDLVEHLEQILTIAITPILEREVEEDSKEGEWAESDQMLMHYRREAALRAHALGRELGEGPVHRWTIGRETFYTWPTRPRRSRLPAADALLPFAHGWSRRWTR